MAFGGTQMAAAQPNPNGAALVGGNLPPGHKNSVVYGHPQSAEVTLQPSGSPGGADEGHLGSGGGDVNQLPDNFGPGRGKWTAADLERLSIEIQGFGQPNAAKATEVVSVFMEGPADVGIAFKNFGARVDQLRIRVTYLHSVAR